MHSLKFALRTLFKTPFVTIVAIVSLALGIGANAAIFSAFNQMLLPVAERAGTGEAREPGGARTQARISASKSTTSLRSGCRRS